MKNRQKNIYLYFIFGLFFSMAFQNMLVAQDQIKGNAENGAKLFKKNCTACHSTDLTKKLIGPPLAGVTDRRSHEWLHKWIKDNKALRESGDKYAIANYEEYNQLEMNLFPQLSEQDIDDILAFTKNPPSPKEEKTLATETANFQQNDLGGATTKIIVLGFTLLAIILLGILFKLYTLIRLINTNTLEEYQAQKPAIKFSIDLSKVLERYRSVGYALIGFFFLAALYGVWDFLMGIDINKGYKPQQPIYFSHKIHTNNNSIDCQYCHSSAKYDKVSGIPTANVCMNCHMTITEYKGNYIEEGKSKEFYTKEIQKIYQSVGWDPSTRKYSGKTKPIQWVRIHNMPDFVYFNHSQHVVAGEEMIKKAKNVDIVCKACHGQVQEMDEVQMDNNFTMGWCINCHRTTVVNMENKYYIEYFSKLHEKLKKQYSNGKRDIKITVDAVGGIECGKCHY
ncbi:MAG: c-type cytochrome [Flavobacteriales bacterium]